MIDPGAFARRSSEKARKQQWDAALADMEQVLTLLPQNGWRRVDAVTLAAMVGDKEAHRKHAEIAVEQAIELSATQPLLAGRLIRSACLLPGALDEYATVADIADEIWPRKKNPYEGMSSLYAYYRAGQYEKLLDASDELIKLEKKNIFHRYFRVLALLNLERTLEAVTELSEVSDRLDARLPPLGRNRKINGKYYDWIVIAFLLARETDEAALEVLNTSLENEPDRVEWLEHRGRL